MSTSIRQHNRVSDLRESMQVLVIVEVDRKRKNAASAHVHSVRFFVLRVFHCNSPLRKVNYPPLAGFAVIVLERRPKSPIHSPFHPPSGELRTILGAHRLSGLHAGFSAEMKRASAFRLWRVIKR